ncbi:DNA polymerase/3'-5' exonuclease PolX [Candidatus Uhrbacteria bacterium]|nr:DNA polymerase/3'-5' exonuclease PolX [Candidatus Uhrbacteria bacterium]
MPVHPLTNQEIADRLEEIGLFLSAEGIAFKPQAYAQAAESVRGLDEELSVMYHQCGEKCIERVPGVGESILEKIIEGVEKGEIAAYRQMKRKYPFDMLALTSLEDVGPKTALALYRTLNIRTLADLKKAVDEGKIAKAEGFTGRREDKLRRALAFAQGHEGRFLLHEGWYIAEKIVEELRLISGVRQAEAAGSIRRFKETVGDVDLLVSTKDAPTLRHALHRLPQVREVIEEGETSITAHLTNGMHCDVRIVRPAVWGAAMLYLSGSKDHNIALRTIAIKKGCKLSEYGLFKHGHRLVAGTEELVYKTLGVPFIPPELREWPGVIEQAKERGMPRLVELTDMQGDLQVQSDWSDGADSLATIVKEARHRGYSYAAITDHSRSLTIARGLDERRLASQGLAIDRFNKKSKGFHLLKGIECDVLRNGKLDFPDAALKTLDIVGISVHSLFSMKEKEMTARIIAAMQNPHVHILFHPTGRVVLERPAYAVDMGRVLRAAKQYGVALEVNGSNRLDLKDSFVEQAVGLGVKLVLDSDAHRAQDMDWMRFAVGTARRGWAKKADVLNTKSAPALLSALKALKT